MIIDVDDYIAHYGTPRHSGRYPWGSGGDDEGQKNRSFLNYVAGLKKQGLSEVEIARGLGITTTQLRAAKTVAKTGQKQADIAMARRLKDKGMSNVAIGERMKINESSVRALLAPGQKEKADILEVTANMIKDQVEKKDYVDIGAGVELHVGVSRTRFNTAVAMLEEQGYKKHYVKVEQLGTGKQTTVKILSKPGVPYSEVYRNRDKIQQITDFSEDGGRSYLGLKTPLSINSKRVAVRYADEGGKDADGVIYVRPGVHDISLGSAQYAQVRISVDGTHYLKGMAMYKDDLPPGVDLMFNTNKNNTGNKLDAMKPQKDDPDNPFGAVVRQLIDPETGNVKSAMNIVNEEGSWERWSKNLPSQMLSKQSPNLARTQLNMTFERKHDELDEITKLTNPAVKKKLLESFSDDADSSAVHLKAAAMRNQRSHVILPIASMKETEVYAPNYENGTRVALIRFPHGGTFEIPELIVNNRQPEAKKLLGRAPDAIGIHSKVAERLSGADFDGDTVLVIPNNHNKIKSSPPLEGLKGFDPQSAYPAYDGMRTMDGGTWNAKTKKVEFEPGQLPSGKAKQFEMGVVSNLITDMTIQRANNAELARAVRHSMVVIDAEKHSLNYKQSAIDNNIKQLKEKYQQTSDSKKRGAATLISRATSEQRVPNRTPRPAQEGGPIDKATGRRMYKPTGETYVDKKGKTVPATFRSTKLAETDDAHTLSSGTLMEEIYANHSNKLKDLANQARKVMVNTKTIPYSPSAKIAYSNEVTSLNAKLNLALRNAPLERQAQILANATYRAKKRANPEMDPAEMKKVKFQALQEMRNRTGAGKEAIEITQEEWNAIQAGAISNDKLSKILDHANLEIVKKLATPKTELKMTDAKKSRASAMLASGYTQAEVAEALGMSVTTLKKGLSDG